MHQMIYAFGIGLSFAVGIFTGAFLCTVATRKGRDEFKHDVLDHGKRVEDRLEKYVEHTGRIAVALELINRTPASK
jgi:hypothetical protein